MEVLKLVCDSWNEAVLHDLSIMQKCGFLCDVKISLSDDNVILAHGCVLSAASPFLRSILRGAESPELDFRDFPSKIFQEVIHFIYTGQITIAKKDVYILYSVANQLNIPALVAMLQHLVMPDASNTQRHCSSSEPDAEKHVNIEIKSAHKASSKDVLMKRADDERHLKEATVTERVEHEIKEQVSKGHTADDHLAQDVMCSEALSAVMVDELSNGSEMTMLENTIHKKGHQLADIVQVNSSSVLCQPSADDHAASDHQSSEEVDYHCNECNVGYASSLHYHKHMHRKHGKALPIDIYILVQKERNARLGLDMPFISDDKNDKTDKQAVIRKSGRRKRGKKYFWDEVGLIDENSCHSSTGSLFKTRTYTRKNIFACSACKREFKTISSLKLHETIHRDERPHKCKVCNRSFSQAGNLRVHERSHTGEKPFQCSQCGRGFGQSGHLKSHMRTHTGEKPFMCSVCGAAFGSKTNLESHMRRHTGEKPYKCTTCGKAFSQLSNLNAHQRSHLGIKPYRCYHCSKAFTALCNYQRHLKRHLLNRPLHCPDCGKGFVNNSEMRRHQRNKHMIVYDPDNHQKLGIHYPTKHKENVVSLV